MNKSSNQLNNSLFFLIAIVFQFFSTSLALAENRTLSQEEITQILAALEERSNAVANAEFTLVLDGEMLPRFQDESVARDYAKLELQGQFERFGKTLSLDDPITNSKYENNVRVYLNGTQKTEAMRYEYSVIGKNQIAIKVFDTEQGKNDLIQIVGRYTEHEAYLLFSETTDQPASLNLYNRTSYLRSSIPIFFHEVILENREKLNVMGYELDGQYVLHAVTTSIDNNSYPYTNYSLYLTKDTLLPERTVGVLIKDNTIIAKRDVLYENTSSSNDISYPSSVLQIYSKLDEYDGVFKEFSIENFSVTNIQFNQSIKNSLDFTIPKGTGVSSFHTGLSTVVPVVNQDVSLSEFLGGIS